MVKGSLVSSGLWALWARDCRVALGSKDGRDSTVVVATAEKRSSMEGSHEAQAISPRSSKRREKGVRKK